MPLPLGPRCGPDQAGAPAGRTAGPASRLLRGRAHRWLPPAHLWHGLHRPKQLHRLAPGAPEMPLSCTQGGVPSAAPAGRAQPHGTTRARHRVVSAAADGDAAGPPLGRPPAVGLWALAGPAPSPAIRAHRRPSTPARAACWGICATVDIACCSGAVRRHSGWPLVSRVMGCPPSLAWYTLRPALATAPCADPRPAAP